ncbi:cytokine-induced anti-apoptosis inhibitor 1, Fe-S biogenesis-domain-containing protein [Lipomyces oligophaga]|uniref:cytokine-induced anti-apoptosis inhibitor 1, Fe-S biogenesis-domain-containing protein n=1 Tax=Lipomyces oligophaga TaxID=45792 RepID=UPI0034CFCC01
MPALLLTHPSLASNQTRVAELTATMDQPVSHQMIDRLATGAVSLPKDFYTSVLVAPSGTSLPSSVISLLFSAVVPGGSIEGVSADQNMDALMGGFLVAGDNSVKTTWTRPEIQKPAAANESSASTSPALTAASSASSEASSIASPKRSHDDIWTIDDDDSFGFDEPADIEADADDLIDEDGLLDGEIPQSINLPVACQTSGKRRRKACKDCTCGLRELELQEEERVKTQQIQVVSLSLDDTAEIDFTIPGKTGSCGNCSLGDAFRCDGCPYLGLPPFKEGEVVSLDAIGNDL